MGQNVKVDRTLTFDGDAKNGVNVINGYLNSDKIFKEWNFQELALDGTNQYTMYLDTTSTVASGSGGALLTTAATDTKTATISCGGIWWYPSKNAVMEAKFSIDVITNVCIVAGLTDAVSEASSYLPFSISGATITDTASNAAMFCFDTGQTTKYWYVVNTKANTEGGNILPASCAPVANTIVRLRVAVDTSGNARYYYNGIQVGYKASATTAGTPLIPYVGIRNNNGSAHVLTLRYVRCWQDA